MKNTLSDFARSRYIVFFLLFFYSTACPQQTSSETESPLKKDFNQALDDGKHILLSPGSWNGSDWLKFSAVIGGTALLSTLDEKAKDIAIENPRYSESIPMKLGKFTGEGVITAAVAGGFYIYGLATKNEDTRVIGLQVAESFVYSGLITTVLKVCIGRYRPYMDVGNYKFLPFSQPFASGANEHFSLPSGHSTVAFALVSVLAAHTDNYLYKTLIYTPAVLTTISRVYQNQHWVSDVFLGAAIGYFVGTYIVNRQSGESSKEQSNMSVGMTGPGLIGFTITF